MIQNLCETFQHRKEIALGTGSRFLLCQLSHTDNRFPKYPSLPVIKCDGFEDVQARSDEPAG